MVPYHVTIGAWHPNASFETSTCVYLRCPTLVLIPELRSEWFAIFSIFRTGVPYVGWLQYMLPPASFDAISVYGWFCPLFLAMTLRNWQTVHNSFQKKNAVMKLAHTCHLTVPKCAKKGLQNTQGRLAHFEIVATP